MAWYVGKSHSTSLKQCNWIYVFDWWTVSAWVMYYCCTIVHQPICKPLHRLCMHLWLSVMIHIVGMGQGSWRIKEGLWRNRQFKDTETATENSPANPLQKCVWVYYRLMLILIISHHHSKHSIKNRKSQINRFRVRYLFLSLFQLSIIKILLCSNIDIYVHSKLAWTERIILLSSFLVLTTHEVMIS